MKALAGFACVLLVLGMGSVGIYQIAYHRGREAGIIVGACAVVKVWRTDLDWSKECRGAK